MGACRRIQLGAYSGSAEVQIVREGDRDAMRLETARFGDTGGSGKAAPVACDAAPGSRPPLRVPRRTGIAAFAGAEGVADDPPNAHDARPATG